MDVINKILTNPNISGLLSVAGLILGLLGVVLAVYFYIKSKRTKEPFCVISNRRVVSSILTDIPGLEVKYNGEKVDNLSITTISFWNAGRETINSIDIPKNSPFLMTAINDSEIYSLDTRFIKRDVNLFQAVLNENKKIIEFSFDFFDRNDGFVIDVVHSGKSEKDLHINAVFKGSKELVRRSTFGFHSSPKILRELFSSDFRMPASLMLFIIPPLAALNQIFEFSPISEEFNYYGNIFAGILITAGGWYLSYKLFKTRVPKGFGFED